MISDTCVILCGGKSNRMGINKAILPFLNYRLITYQIIKLSRIFANVAISIKDDKKDEIAEILRNDISKYNDNNNNMPINIKSIKFILEDSSYFSPLFGILNCFNQLNNHRLFFIPIDYPFIKLKTINTIIDNIYDCDIIYAKDAKMLHPLIGIWKSNLTNKILSALQNKNFKILDFLLLCNAKSIFFHSDEFINLNTMQDYKNAIKILKS